MKKPNTIALVIAGVVLLLGGYWFFSSGSGNQAPLTATTPSSGSAAQLRFRTLLNELPTSFNTNIFSDPKFRSLTDIATPIAAESIGRLDPFAPLSSASAVAPASASTAGGK